MDPHLLPVYFINLMESDQSKTVNRLYKSVAKMTAYLPQYFEHIVDYREKKDKVKMESHVRLLIARQPDVAT